MFLFFGVVSILTRSKGNSNFCTYSREVYITTDTYLTRTKKN